MRERKHLITNCVRCNSAEDLQALYDLLHSSREIRWNTFLRHVTAQELSSEFPEYAWGRQSGLRMGKDYALRFYAGRWKCQPAVFVVHSAIEYIFC